MDREDKASASLSGNIKEKAQHERSIDQDAGDGEPQPHKIDRSLGEQQLRDLLLQARLKGSLVG